MSMNFKNRTKHYLLMIFCGFCLAVGIVYTLQPFAKGFNYDEFKPKYRNKAWYVLELENVPIGTVEVSLAHMKKGTAYDYNLKLASRVGVSPISFAMVVNATELVKKERQIEQKLYTEYKPVDLLSQTSDVSHSASLKEIEDIFLSNKKNFFYDEGQIHNFNEVLNPLSQNILAYENEFSADYSKDNFLKTASIQLNDHVSIEFKRVNEEKYIAESKKIFAQRIDLDAVNSLSGRTNEIDFLLKELSACQAQMQNLNKSILKQMPYESYLTYRRIINMEHFCSGLEKELIISDENKEEIILSHVMTLFKEDPSELPHAVTQFPDKTSYYNRSVSFLWPKITAAMIQNASDELMNLFQLDLNRKSLLGIQLKMRKMQRNAVVRANISQLNSELRFFVQTSNEPRVKYVNGVEFAKNQNMDFGSICASSKGAVGIDLEQPANKEIVDGKGIRGVWGIETQLLTARLFAIKAAVEKRCELVYIKTNPAFIRFLQQEIDTFRNESLSRENSLLLSNYGQKKLWVMPGKYRITIVSIINEKVISVQDFTVDKTTQTNVIANVQ